METLPETDIDRLKAAYRERQTTVTLSDGRTIRRVPQLRFNSCGGCVFTHTIGCYCADGGIWIEVKQ